MTAKGSSARKRFSGYAAILAAILILFPSRILSAEPQRQVVAYYFHTTIRCATCLLIEERSGEVLRETFVAEIADGQLQWQTVNVQAPENRDYITRLRVRPKSLTLIEYYDEVPTEKKELPEVWRLIHGDQDIFRRYLTEEVRSFLKTSKD
jgi:hypothetical protein